MRIYLIILGVIFCIQMKGQVIEKNILIKDSVNMIEIPFNKNFLIDAFKLIEDSLLLKVKCQKINYIFVTGRSDSIINLEPKSSVQLKFTLNTWDWSTRFLGVSDPIFFFRQNDLIFIINQKALEVLNYEVVTSFHSQFILIKEDMECNQTMPVSRILSFDFSFNSIKNKLEYIRCWDIRP